MIKRYRFRMKAFNESKKDLASVCILQLAKAVCKVFLKYSHAQLQEYHRFLKRKGLETLFFALNLTLTNILFENRNRDNLLFFSNHPLKAAF